MTTRRRSFFLLACLAAILLAFPLGFMAGQVIAYLTHHPHP
jgi:hypothetical protein